MSTRLIEKEGFAALLLRLRGAGIADRELLADAEATPRTLFVPPAFADAAYSSRLVPIDCGAFMEGADLAIRMLWLLGLAPGQRVLEIGTGSGFTAAIMARRAARVVTIERYRTLVTLAEQRFSHLGLTNIVARQADGRGGSPADGTFDRILVTAAFSGLPRSFADQLASGGVMLAPILAEDGEARLARLTKIGSRFEREDLFAVPFEPLIPDVAAAL